MLMEKYLQKKCLFLWKIKFVDGCEDIVYKFINHLGKNLVDTHQRDVNSKCIFYNFMINVLDWGLLRSIFALEFKPMGSFKHIPEFSISLFLFFSSLFQNVIIVPNHYLTIFIYILNESGFPKLKTVRKWRNI